MEPQRLINLTEFPLHSRATPAYTAVVERARRQLLRDHFLHLDGFLSAEGTVVLAAEAVGLLPVAHHRSSAQENPYSEPPTDDMPPDHPYRLFATTERHGLAHHQMPEGGALDSLYRWAPMRQFVADVTGHERLHLHADPSNALVLQIYKPSAAQPGTLAWHFDRAGFSTIINLQEASEGGAFEFAPAIRSATDPNFDAVRDILLGEPSPLVRAHHAAAGSLSIILGQDTLHRVAPVLGGERARITAVLSYEPEPGVKLPPEIRRRFFGADAPLADGEVEPRL